jgi:CheY-like chemotaxis protein
VQIESVILNLSINSRDAMPNGGVLTIETANIPAHDPRRPADLAPRDYVVIAVSDNGTGMSDEVAARVFEPFFSTKERGRGAGLGLSQVLGTAQQLGGGVRLKTKLGEGTRVEVYLPRTDAKPRLSVVERPQAPAPVSSATLLVVDDQEEVRDVAVAHVETLGYRVVSAPSGRAALEVLEQRADIDLLFTDFAMPGMSGLELARAIEQARPELPVILVTGYSDIANAQELRGLQLLKKPYRLDDLGAAIERALRGRPHLAVVTTG